MPGQVVAEVVAEVVTAEVVVEATVVVNTAQAVVAVIKAVVAVTKAEAVTAAAAAATKVEVAVMAAAIKAANKTSSSFTLYVSQFQGFPSPCTLVPAFNFSLFPLSSHSPLLYNILVQFSQCPIPRAFASSRNFISDLP